MQRCCFVFLQVFKQKRSGLNGKTADRYVLVTVGRTPISINGAASNRILILPASVARVTLHGVNDTVFAFLYSEICFILSNLGSNNLLKNISFLFLASANNLLYEITSI